MRTLVRVFDVLNEKGFRYVFKRVLSEVIRKRIHNFVYIKRLFANKSGLEVGGPSRIFRNDGFVPLYKIIKELDGCNFSNRTIWEGNIENGEKYNYYKNKEGTQYVSEATDLSLTPSSKYEFVISSNCLEHVANPLKAIEEWVRVVKKGGLLFLVLPNKDYCFDHNRPITEFFHLLEDYHNNITENDLTHLNEILELHDLKMDEPAGSLEQFKARSLKNFENRALHQHVFDISLLKEIFSYFKLEVLLTHEGQEYMILGKKTA